MLANLKAWSCKVGRWARQGDSILGCSWESAESCCQGCVVKTPGHQDRVGLTSFETCKDTVQWDNRILLFKTNLWAHLLFFQSCFHPKFQHMDRVINPLYYSMRSSVVQTISSKAEYRIRNLTFMWANTFICLCQAMLASSHSSRTWRCQVHSSLAKETIVGTPTAPKLEGGCSHSPSLDLWMPHYLKTSIYVPLSGPYLVIIRASYSLSLMHLLITCDLLRPGFHFQFLGVLVSLFRMTLVY